MSFDIRSAIRWVANGKSFETFVSALERMEQNQNVLRVLMYHRVNELAASPDLSPRALSATPESFALQMQFLAETCDVMSLPQLIDAKRNGFSLPRRAVLITFDDAYRDFSEHAWPILQRFHLPATLFVPTAYPDHPERRFWWDRLYHAVMSAAPATYHFESFKSITLSLRQGRESGYRLLSDHTESLGQSAASEFVDEVCAVLAAPTATGQVLSWNQLRSLAGPMLTLAPHTQTHPLLNRVRTSEALDEILGSLDDLQREIGETPRVLSYPGGALTADVVSALRAADFELAFTTRRGVVNWKRDDPLLLNRINVGYRCPVGLLRGQLLGMTRHFQGQPIV